jgi:hypothetical protein
MLSLPVELISEIAKYLPTPSIRYLARTCKRVYSALLDELFWRTKCFKEFPWAFNNGFCLGLQERDQGCEYRHQSLEFGRELSNAEPLAHLRRKVVAPSQPVKFFYRHAYLSIFYSQHSLLVEILDPKQITATEVYVTYHRNLENPEKGVFHCISRTRFPSTQSEASNVTWNRGIYTVVAKDYRDTYKAASPRTRDREVLIDATRLVQHPKGSHEQFRRIMEHMLPVYTRKSPNFLGIDTRPIKNHYDLCTSQRSDRTRHPYLKPLSVGSYIEVEEWDRTSGTFRSYYGVVEQTPVEGNKFKFSGASNPHWKVYVYSKLDGVRYNMSNVYTDAFDAWCVNEKRSNGPDSRNREWDKRRVLNHPSGDCVAL